MSTITLKSNTVMNQRTKNTIKDRIVNYLSENRNMIALGLYTISGRVPDIEVLRDMKVL